MPASYPGARVDSTARPFDRAARGEACPGRRAFAGGNAVDGDPGTRWGSAFGDPQWIYVDLGATAAIERVVLTWEAAFGRSYQIQVSDNATAWTTIFSTTTGDGGTDDLTVAGTGRYVRMNGTARGTAFGYSLFELQVFGTPVTAAGLLSQGKPAVASSIEGAFTAAGAVDGNTGTRWSSAFSDPQWIYVDLGGPSTINRVVLSWEAVFGRAYQIQTSDNATAWTTIFSTTTGDGGIDDLAVSGTGRYVRMNGTARGTAFGYSLFELQVFGAAGGGGGDCAANPGVPTGVAASGVTGTSVNLSWTAPSAGANCTITGYRVRVPERHPGRDASTRSPRRRRSTCRPTRRAGCTSTWSPIPTIRSPAPTRRAARTSTSSSSRSAARPRCATSTPRGSTRSASSWRSVCTPRPARTRWARTTRPSRTAARRRSPSSSPRCRPSSPTWRSRRSRRSGSSSRAPATSARAARSSTTMDSWVDQLWASNGITVPKPTFFCNPIEHPDLSAACYRHVGLGALNPNGSLKAGNTLRSSSAGFYPSAPAHYYARFWHTHAHGGRPTASRMTTSAATPASSPGPTRST